MSESISEEVGIECAVDSLQLNDETHNGFPGNIEFDTPKFIEDIYSSDDEIEDEISDEISDSKSSGSKSDNKSDVNLDEDIADRMLSDIRRLFDELPWINKKKVREIEKVIRGKSNISPTKIPSRKYIIESYPAEKHPTERQRKRIDRKNEYFASKKGMNYIDIESRLKMILFPNQDFTVSIEEIIIVAGHHGISVFFTQEQLISRYISARSSVEFVCKYGHKWRNEARSIARRKCHICYNHNRTRIPPDYEFIKYISDELVMLKCDKGHILVYYLSNIRKNCKSCAMMATAAESYGNDAYYLDVQTVHFNNYSKMRFHCNKLRHNPNCNAPSCMKLAQIARENINTIDTDRMNYDERCINYVPCDQDFYALHRMMTNKDHIVHDCRNDHRWELSSVHLSMRIFEMIFDRKFNEYPGPNVNFSGYNSEVNIAFIYEGDFIQEKYLNEHTMKFVKSNKISLFIIVHSDGNEYKDFKDSASYIIKKIIDQSKQYANKSQLSQFNIVVYDYLKSQSDDLALYENAYQQLKMMSQSRKLFVDRCEKVTNKK